LELALNADDRLIDRITKQQLYSSSMNNAKWVRLLDALSPTIGENTTTTVKLVWDETIRSMQIDGKDYNFDYYDRAMEAMIGGLPKGWYSYKEIEWVCFSADAPALDSLATTIASVGQFDTERTVDTLKLYAYRRKHDEFNYES
jgi:hypothetical protein